MSPNRIATVHLILAATLAAPLTAQDSRRTADPQLSVAYDSDRWILAVEARASQDDAMVAVLVSTSPATVSLLGVDLLSPSLVLTAGIGRASFELDFNRAGIDPRELGGDFYFEAIALAETLRVSEIEHLSFNDGERRAPDGGGTDGDLDHTGDDLPWDGPRVQAAWMDGKGVRVEVEAPSNDYALYIDSTVRRSDGMDVYLFLEEPGEGQGMLDIVEFHDVIIDVRNRGGNRIRVFIERAQRDARRSHDYRLAATLER